MAGRRASLADPSPAAKRERGANSGRPLQSGGRAEEARPMNAFSYFTSTSGRSSAIRRNVWSSCSR